jgi:hypothetical protein
MQKRDGYSSASVIVLKKNAMNANIRRRNMSKFCPLANSFTNCTDNCNSCLEEEVQAKSKDDELLEDLHLEQLEQM